MTQKKREGKVKVTQWTFVALRGPGHNQLRPGPQGNGRRRGPAPGPGPGAGGLLRPSALLYQGAAPPPIPHQQGTRPPAMLPATLCCGGHGGAREERPLLAQAPAGATVSCSAEVGVAPGAPQQASGSRGQQQLLLYGTRFSILSFSRWPCRRPAEHGMHMGRPQGSRPRQALAA